MAHGKVFAIFRCLTRRPALLQQTMNVYMNVGNRQTDMVGRGLYQEIALIEEEHVTQYGSLEDPRLSWFEMAVLHEYNECYLYWSCMQSEIPPWFCAPKIPRGGTFSVLLANLNFLVNRKAGQHELHHVEARAESQFDSVGSLLEIFPVDSSVQ
jgi:hypothetical protein